MNIPEDKKYWLVVWIAFEGLVSQIRPFVRELVQREYQSLRSSDHIHLQTLQRHLNLYYPRFLFYENINGNIHRKLPSGEFDINEFDYRITNYVDFAKIHVEPAMANFSAIDGKCDGSALLLLLGRVQEVFSRYVESSAMTVKKDVRNALAHPNFTEWNAGKFQSCFQKMQQLVESMRLPSADEDKILSGLNYWKTTGLAFFGNSLEDPTLLSLINNKASELRVKPPTFFGILEGNRYFIGRKKELENLGKAFGNTDTEPDVCGVAGKKANVHGICGLGGCGKSSLAFEYALRNKKSYPGGIFVVNGESDDLMMASLQGILGEFVHNTQSNQHEEAKQFEQLLTETLSWLGILKNKWLLLVDNMDQKELSPCIRKMICGQWKNKTSVDILVTSRRSCQMLCEDLDLSSEDVFELDAFSLDESVKFLKERIELPSSCKDQDQGERELAQELGGLPLALEQAAAYIKASNCSIQSYLQQYRSQRSTLLNSKSAKPRSEIYKKERLAVQTTWLLNFSYIENDKNDPELGKAAAFFMKIAAYLSPDEIPIEILNVGTPEVEHEDMKDRLKMPIGAKQIVDLLIRFSLFKRKSHDTLSIHRLVQETLRDLCEGKGETDKVVSSAIRMLHRSFLNCVGRRDFLHEMLSVNAFHLVGYLMRDSSLKPAFFCEESARLFCEAAFFSHSQGMQSKGYRLQQVALEILCAMKEPIRYYKGDELIEAIRISAPPLYPSTLMEVVYPDGNETDIPVDTNQSDELLEKIKVIEPKAKEAFNRRDFQTSVNLCSEIVKMSNFSINRGTIEVNQPYLVPLGEILCCRGIAHVQMGNFETAVDDFNASTYLDIQCYRGYYWKAYALCKLVESGRTEFTSRAQAAAAVLHYKFADSKSGDIQKLQKTFPGLLHRIEGMYKFVSRVSELKELENGPYGAQNDLTNDSLTIILANGDYDLKEVAILGGCYYFVGLPGSSASLNCSKGLYLSHGSFLCENVRFVNPLCPLTYESSSAVPSCTTEGKMPLVITLGRAHQTEPELSAGTERELSALIEANDVNSLVIIHCHFFGSCCSGIIVKTTESCPEKITVSLRSSVISSCLGSGFKLQGDKADCCISIYDNVLKLNMDGIVIDSPSHFYMKENYIVNSVQSGVVAWGSFGGELLSNFFVGNGRHGILLNHSNAEMTDNVIDSNRGWGIVCCFKTNLTCYENMLQNNGCGGLRIMFNGEGDVSVQRCEFRENSGPAVFPTAANELCPLELNLGEWITTEHQTFPVLFLLVSFLELTEMTPFESIGEFIGEFKPPFCDGLRVTEVSDMLFHCEKKICHKCWKHLQLDSDLIECPSCHVARYCSKQCADMAKAGHYSVCKSILEANEVFVGRCDVWPLTNPELPVQDDHQNKAGIFPCVIVAFSLPPPKSPSPERCGKFPCFIVCPQRKVFTVLNGFKIRDLALVHGCHIPDFMTDIKAACTFANFDSDSGNITIYKHQICPLDKVPDGLNLVKKETFFAFINSVYQRLQNP